MRERDMLLSDRSAVFDMYMAEKTLRISKAKEADLCLEIVSKYKRSNELISKALDLSEKNYDSCMSTNKKMKVIKWVIPISLGLGIYLGAALTK